MKNLLQPKSLDFTIAKGQVFYSENIGTIAIPFVDGLSLELNNVAYALDYDSNLILLGTALGEWHHIHW